MAAGGEPWNRVNIPFPGAVSCVRIRFDSNTGENVRTLLVETEKVLVLVRSEILQTEVRVLYELLYILHNSSKGNKTYKGMKQVEQCISRLKSMKLDAALQELIDLCPTKVQRGLSIKTGVCDVPSQPMLEWLCLKVLGAARLMSCMLSRCSRAFSLSKQQMNWDEFVILNLLITSMLSRFWVIFRGVLVGLSSLYQQLLVFLREVTGAQPMPFLTDFCLPADMTQFLGPCGAFSLNKRASRNPHTQDHKRQQRGAKTSSVKVKIQGQKRKVQEDLGVAIERGAAHDADMKPFLKVFRDFTEGKSLRRETHKSDKKQQFTKQVRAATTFADMATRLEEMIRWCKSQRMEKQKRLLTFLRLKCQRMKSLEAAGYNLQKKLRAFRQEAGWASSPRGSEARSCRSSAVATRRHARRRTRFHSLRSRFKSSAVRAGVKKRRLKRRRKTAERSVSGLSGDDRGNGTTPQTTHCNVPDDIDDIFSSAGF